MTTQRLRNFIFDRHHNIIVLYFITDHQPSLLFRTVQIIHSSSSSSSIHLLDPPHQQQ